MKALIQGVILVCAMILLTMDSCSDITGDPCDDTMMKNPDEPTIYLKLHLMNEFDSPDPTHIVSDADKIIYAGIITKYYCGDKKSGRFEFVHTLFLSKDYTPEYLRNGVFLPQPYTFKFENDGDYLQVATQMKQYFNDGKIFKNEISIYKHYYKDISYDATRMDKYIDLYLPMSSKWTEVTSK
jgi:hypothetical protein